jgi:hypothetical protein
MFDFPPAPKLNPIGRLDPGRAIPSEMRGEQIFFGIGARGHPRHAGRR